jgi:hypothetical protein
MTSQLIRLQAKEMAGCAYQGEIFEVTGRFRLENPSQDAFVAKYWPHYVQLAKETLVLVLRDESTPQYQKDLISEALIEHFEQSESSSARQILQVTSVPREREDVRHVDSNPQLAKVRA